VSASGSITDVPGIRVGHVTDRVGLTGCTVVLCDAPAVGGVTLRGWANAVHGLEFLDPRHIVPGVDGALLAGGSAYGLEAVWGVMRFLEGRGTGFRAGPTVVPHVPAAILFDLNVGDMHARPTREMGYAAAANATPAAPGEGSVGAGTGATVGKLPSQLDRFLIKRLCRFDFAQVRVQYCYIRKYQPASVGIAHTAQEHGSAFVIGQGSIDAR